MLTQRLMQFLLISNLFICPIALLGEIPPPTFQTMPPMNEIYHPVSTNNPVVQERFNKGLTYIFAFNHDLAFREFEQASKIEPHLAMAYWGMALALGQNVNTDVTPENEAKAYKYIQKALELKSNASKSEQEYISALAVRYTNDPKVDLVSLRFLYRDAMKKVMNAYPEDLDAASLYAESILNLDPWKWWNRDGKPSEGVLEAIQVLESVLNRNPDHIGANHYYIHALEESPHPERALMSAHRLEYLLPESGHLLHMPCHIFVLVGDYENAMKTNKRAIEQDRKYINRFGVSSGPYPLHYLSHNLFVMCRIYMLMEDYENAIKTSFEAVKFFEPHLHEMPQMETHLVRPLEVYFYFHKWNEILDYNLRTKNPSALSYWHFVRAMAFAALGEIDQAQKEKELMLKEKAQINPEDTLANNPATKVIDLGIPVLEAQIAHAIKNDEKAIEFLKAAVILQENLFYDEPPAWIVPIQQKLGFAYLRLKQYKEAENAFLVTLKELKRNGRTLFGLTLSLRGQERTIDAYWVEREMKAALKYASSPLNAEDM